MSNNYQNFKYDHVSRVGFGAEPFAQNVSILANNSIRNAIPKSMKFQKFIQNRVVVELEKQKNISHRLKNAEDISHGLTWFFAAVALIEALAAANGNGNASMKAAAAFGICSVLSFLVNEFASEKHKNTNKANKAHFTNNRGM